MKVLAVCCTDRFTLEKSKLVNYGPVLRYPEGSVKHALYIDVGDYKGKGMTENNGSIQNMAEAEYAIALYMWVKINKHKFKQEEKSVVLTKDRITIVASEEGQRKLIQEIVTQKCGWHPMVGVPDRVCTLEEFILSGHVEANETVIISMTYTNVIGNILNYKIFTPDLHLWLNTNADYVLCRKDLFETIVDQRLRDWALQVDPQTTIKDFRGLYKVVQGQLEKLENSTVQEAPPVISTEPEKVEKAQVKTRAQAQPKKGAKAKAQPAVAVPFEAEKTKSEEAPAGKRYNTRGKKSQ